MQTLVTQQPPLAQVSAAQHASPAAPQVVQVPLPVPAHTLPLPQVRPVQHDCPPPPHVSHTPPLQIAPLLQVLPAQHAVPAAPQVPPSPPLLLPLPPPLPLSVDASPPELLPDELPLPPPSLPELLPLPLPEPVPELLPELPLLPSVDASEPPVVVEFPPHASTTPSTHAVEKRIDVFMAKLPPDGKGRTPGQPSDGARVAIAPSSFFAPKAPGIQRSCFWRFALPTSAESRVYGLQRCGSRSDYPFTPPAVSPATSCRCAT
jgi:hypothetical protein